MPKDLIDPIFHTDRILPHGDTTSAGHTDTVKTPHADTPAVHADVQKVHTDVPKSHIDVIDRPPE